MSQSTDSNTLHDYIRVLSGRRRLIIATTLVAVAVGMAYSLVREPTYEATATVNFRDQAEQFAVFTPGTPLPAQFQPEKQAAADTRIVTRDDVIDRVQGNLNSGMSDDQLRDAITATVQPDSNLVAITASADSAELSARLANEFAEQTKNVARRDDRDRFSNLARDLQASIKAGGLDPATEASYEATVARLRTVSKVAEPVEISRPADVPESPASPKPVRDTILAGILGLMLGTGAAFLQNTLDRRVKDAHEVQHELGLPLVGHVRSDTLGLAGMGRNGDGFVSEDDLEAFRILRTNVDFLARDQHLSSIIVTSALPEEGKSTVAAWYAYASAVAGRRTVLVECDFRRPVLANRFGVEPAPGLADYLAGDAKPGEVLRSVPVHGREAVDVLPLIPAGRNAFQPAEMIGSKRFTKFADQIGRAYDLVVYDSAPLLPVGDTLELLPVAGGVLLCVRLGQTTHEQAQAAKAAMSHLADKPTGLVVTGLEVGSDDDYYGYYSYRAPASVEEAR